MYSCNVLKVCRNVLCNQLFWQCGGMNSYLCIKFVPGCRYGDCSDKTHVLHFGHILVIIYVILNTYSCLTDCIGRFSATHKTLLTKQHDCNRETRTGPLSCGRRLVGFSQIKHLVRLRKTLWFHWLGRDGLKMISGFTLDKSSRLLSLACADLSLFYARSSFAAAVTTVAKCKCGSLKAAFVFNLYGPLSDEDSLGILLNSQMDTRRYRWKPQKAFDLHRGVLTEHSQLA